MNFETIQSYLVALGARVDEAQFKKFFDKLDQAGKAVEKHTSGMAKEYVKAGTAVVGVLASITVATAGLMDKVAQSDLGYQLYAMKMYMATDKAKKLKIAVDALGHSFEEIAWNPELNERFRDLIKLQNQLQAQMPADFEESMRSIRDIGFEFTKMKVIIEWGLQLIGEKLTKYLAGPMGNLMGKLKEFNKWLKDHLEEWTAKIAKALAVVVQLFGDVVRFGKELWTVLERLWNSLSKGQKAVVAIALGLELLFMTGPLGIAFAAISAFLLLLDDFYAYVDGRKSSKTLAPIWGKVLIVTEALSHALSWVVDKLQQVYDQIAESGTFAQFWSLVKETGAAAWHLAEGIGHVIEKLLGMKAAAVVWKVMKVAVDEAAKSVILLARIIVGLLDAAGLAMSGHLTEARKRMAETWEMIKDSTKNMVETAQGKTAPTTQGKSAPASLEDIKAAPLPGIAAQESGGNYYAVNPQSGAIGKYQIMPQNWAEWAKAAGLGKNAPTTPENQEIVYKSRMDYYMKKYGNDMRLAAAAWYGGEGAANRLQKGDLSVLNILPRNQWAGPNIGDYINSVMGEKKTAYGQPIPASPNVTVTTTLGDVNVTVAGTHASADEIARKTRDAVDAMLTKRQQRLAFEMNGVLG
jgi:hypothetical protein